METQINLNNSSILPSAKDLLYVVPRLAQRAIGIVPDAMDLAGKIWGEGGSMIADATGQMTMNSTITNTSTMLAQSTATTLESAMTEAWREGGADDAASSMFGMFMQGIARVKNFGGIFSYLTSRWALATFTAAVILNRTQFYASSREHLRLRWHTRLAIYMIPICAFLVQLLYITQALRCQTSPDFAQIRYGDPLKNLAIDFASEGGFLYKFASTLLFWQDDTTCCAAQHMSLSSVDGDRSELRGSLSLLFWFFITLCTSQLFETLCCALQGKQPMPETGMTIFEHSLAFAECEAMISSALGFGFFGLPKIGNSGDGTAVVTRGEIMQRLNVPPEVLLVCVISCLSHLSSAVLAVTGIRHKVRLVNTGIWALCYMSALLWSFLKVFLKPTETITDLGVLRFPTVCIVGFIPHILILVGITVCGAIYSLALIVTALSVPEEVSGGMSYRERLSWAYSNLQANVQFSSASSIRIKMSEDFYTTLLKIGFSVLTAASEAVYLNEGSRIQVAKMTWLEQKRIDELAGSIEQRQVPSVPAELLGEGIARGVDYADHQNAAISLSPYARERKSKTISGQPDRPQAGELDSGLGLTQRRSRMHLTFDFVAGILGLIISVQAQLVLNVLTRIGIERRPAWLLKAAGIAEGQRRASLQPVSLQKSQGRDFWMVGPNGQLVVPQNDDVDVEAETRQRLTAAGNYTGEDTLSNQLYDWWQSGGWFGTVDGSGEYADREIEDDLTSMVSVSTDTTDDRSDIDDNSGRRTPTQEDPYGDREAKSTEDTMDVALLSRLLNPQSAADREEARLLSYSLLSQRPMTRSQYRREVDRSRSQLLTGLHGQSASASSSEEEEERDLEHFIMSQRSKARAQAAAAGGGNTWQNGAAGMGEAGPQCVVCQSSPRTILVWPCGCLSACDDCRVGLAARNYNKCICCRTDIAAYSRLYVP